MGEKIARLGAGEQPVVRRERVGIEPTRDDFHAPKRF